MAKLSVIIPARNERFLPQTVDDIFLKATGDIEIIVVLDGYWPDPPLGDYKNLVIVHRSQSRGMRPAINSAAAIAKGEYLLKTDAHCLFADGFDKTLQADCKSDWVCVPRRKRLDAENWCVEEGGRPPIDYMYLSYPDNPDDFGGPGLNGKVWAAKNRDESLKDKLIDDLMSAQGSCWFMPRDYFYELELMDTESYGHFWNEFQEIGLKCWLSGGRVIRNKKTWYAHLHKGRKYGRGYFLSKDSLRQGATYTKKWLIGDAWHKQTKPLSWLIEQFWPVPTWTEEGLANLKSMEKSL
jgi:glycosyltransferase involved in cell wall biosynthesis